MSQSHLKLFKLAYPKSTHPASPIASCRNHSEGSGLCFLYALCLQIASVFFLWPPECGMDPALGNCDYLSIFVMPVVSLSVSFTVLYLDNNKTYILTQ